MAVGKTVIIVFLLFIVSILTRIPLVENMHSHTDSSSITLALVNYDLNQETPAPPGYPLYLTFGKLIYYIVRDPHQALIIVSIISTALGALGFYFLGKYLDHENTGIISAIVFLSSPAIFFFGLTIYPYLFMIGIEVLFVFFAYITIFKKRNTAIFIGVFYALLLGIRPQEILLTLPLAVYVIYKLSNKAKLHALVAFGVITIAWLMPFIFVNGGVRNYYYILSNGASEALPLPSFNPLIYKRFELLNGAFVTLGVSSIFAIYQLIKMLIGNKKTNYLILLALWAIPSLLFNLFIRTEHAGYQQGYLMPCILLASIALRRVYSVRKILAIVCIAIVVLINLYIFFYNRDPLYQKPYRQSSFHYTDIVRNDYVLSEKFKYIKSNFAPDKTIIFAGPYFWRHVRYYLPEFEIYMIGRLFEEEDSNLLIKAYGLRFEKIWNTNRTLDLPDKVTSIVIFDDEGSSFEINKKRIVKFKGITSLTIVPVSRAMQIGYHKIYTVIK